VRVFEMQRENPHPWFVVTKNLNNMVQVWNRILRNTSQGGK